MGQRIAKIRDQRGASRAEIAASLGIAAESLAALERGERRATNDELVRLSEALSVSLNELLSSRRSRADVEPRFRLARQVGLRDARHAVDTLTVLARKFVDLEQVLGIERPITPLESLETYHVSGRQGIDPRLAGEHAAATVRDALGVGNGPAVGLAERLEVEAGLRIFFLDDLPDTVAGLVIWTRELGGCIGINREHPLGRRRWSLAQEVAHFLRDREAGNVLPTAGRHRRTSADIFSESFTKAFLLPRASVSKQFADRCRANGGHFAVADILWMARLYEVSFSRMTRRLEELGFFPNGTYERLTANRYTPEPGIERVDIVGESRPFPGRFPMRYTAMALEAYERSLISERELAEFLETDRFSVRRLYQEWRLQRFADGSEVELDLSEEVVTLS